MKTKHNLKLIEGKFIPSEAGKVLSGLINYKINYHQMELFSNEERFGKDVSNSKKRIEELKAVTGSLKKIIDFTSDKGQILQLSCAVEIIILNAE